jgi:membrane protease YdiL (CAAX protease family)
METTGRAQFAPWRLAAWLGFVLLITGLNYLGRVAGEDPPDDLAYRWSSSVGAVVVYAVTLLILLLISWGLPRREVFALRRPPSWGRAAGYTAVALMAIWLASVALSPFLDADDEQGFVPDNWDSSRAPAFVAFFVSVAVVAPIVEELTYRGLGFALLAPYGTVLAVIATGVLFGLSHGLLVGLPILTAFGLAIGWLRAKSDSIYPPMILHGIFNGTALIVSVAFL